MNNYQIRLDYLKQKFQEVSDQLSRELRLPVDDNARALCAWQMTGLNARINELENLFVDADGQIQTALEEEF